MDAMALARRLAGLGQSKEACQAYTLALEGAAPEEKMEAALYILQSGGDYRISYTCFQELYRQGHFREDCLSIMTQAFYEPNIKALKKRYEKNCKLLAKYPYLFKKDFVPFEDLPIRFYPYDDTGYLPFYVEAERFGDYLNLKYPVVSRNFFKNLDKPILADSVYSQYELEYLKDNVRDSERVGRENHVYLHYPDWGEFCAYLQCWSLRPLLEGEKLVFLIGDELEQYPIDFKARFGIDYSQCAPKPVGIREINKLVWHTQLSSHNGGDFFNEVFDGHPNLLVMPSVYLEMVEGQISDLRKGLNMAGSLEEALSMINLSPHLLTELYHLKKPTDKDLMAALFLNSSYAAYALDQNARIAPAVFFQPHFMDLQYSMEPDSAGRTVLSAKSLDELRSCRFFNEFRYIKTFTPMRRITNSYAATVRFMYLVAKMSETGKSEDQDMVVGDAMTRYLLNRSFLIDPEDRFYQDSVLVRFEDGKLNPKATFTALAAFLDLPYTESMTYCSEKGVLNPHHETKGFDPVSVYRTHDEYANETERYFIEYFMRDAYEFYGYDFHFYDGSPIDEEKVRELIAGFTTLNGYIQETWQKMVKTIEVDCGDQKLAAGEEERIREEAVNRSMVDHIQRLGKNRLKIAKSLLRGLRFVNRRGQPLRMMPMLEPDPALLEQPLYH
ncbi:hypothetical protein D1641_11155 [Colidextribacter sp. OB.20]|uniref:hypothetical protein n=1 Tax=Colidextribacter sp. OB.20 TaxID=2304568 RepID=UPI00136EEA25|nr:hypothetical protein [Colidextribacter sp. OB.20]NBI10566.1 hypothetical protein [Colidextribacter sp. OB.20]